MSENKQESKIIPYPSKKSINVGIITFSIILIYLIATIVSYLTEPRITAYEVRQGSILKDTAYTGLILREESIIYADASGYGNYYIENNSKVRVGAELLTIVKEKIQYAQSGSQDDIALTEEQIKLLLLKIQSFGDQFSENDYDTVYQLKQELQAALDKYANQSMTEQLKDILSSDPNLVILNTTANINGIVVYAIDYMENLSFEDVTLKHLSGEKYKKTEFINNSEVDAGEPLFKIVTDEKWQLVIAIDEETKTALDGKKSVKVRFRKDNQTIRGTISFSEQDPSIACITFENSMIRYINERYTDVELILEDESGLKIPKTAETTKKFYIVPKSYLTLGGNSSKEGVLVKSTDKNGNAVAQFLAVTVYYEEDGYVYLDTNVFGKTSTLLKPNSTETYELNQIKTLRGVYCINKGYAVFRQIKVLCESDEYYIVQEGNAYGLSNYDHIALDSSAVRENDMAK